MIPYCINKKYESVAVKPLVNIKNITWLGILKGKCNKMGARGGAVG